MARAAAAETTTLIRMSDHAHARDRQNRVTGCYPTGLTRHDLLTPEEVAELLQKSRKWVMASAREGRLRGVKLGRDWRFLRRDVDDYVFVRWAA
jgi:excisionase family DNA binding protein